MKADALEAKYGSILREPPFSELTTARQLYNAFKDKYPRVEVGEQAFKT